MVYSQYEVRHFKEHVEIYLHGVFQFSADTVEEAYQEIKEMECAV